MILLMQQSSRSACRTGTGLARGEQCLVADDLVDQLLAQTGLHLGRSLQVPDQIEGAARIVVTALPGGSAVALDYEGLAADQQRPRRHAEHSVLGRTSTGLALYTAHIHGGGAWGGPLLTELRETEPGYFEAIEGSSPFPLAIRVEVPSATRIVYSWLFGPPGGEVELRNVGDVALIA
jgi:hypothetical protein